MKNTADITPRPGSRLDYNLKILERARQFFIDYPDMRWGQGMINMGLMGDDMRAWMVESKEVYEGLRTNMGESNQEKARKVRDVIIKAIKEAGLDEDGVSIDKNGNIIYNLEPKENWTGGCADGDDPSPEEEAAIMDHNSEVLEAYGEWESDLDPMINDMIEIFDVDQAADMYKYNDWRWYRSGKDVIPTSEMIRDQIWSLARTLCGELILKWKNRKEDEYVQYKISTGRLEVSGFIDAGETPDMMELTINLVPLSASNYE